MERHLPYGISQSQLTRVNEPHFNPSQIGRWSIYLHQKGGRLSCVGYI